jgi:hypothetical protein
MTTDQTVPKSVNELDLPAKDITSMFLWFSSDNSTNSHTNTKGQLGQLADSSRPTPVMKLAFHPIPVKPRAMKLFALSHLCQTAAPSASTS